MSKPHTIAIGTSEAGPVKLDVKRLVTTRLLVTANSGGGKSWLLRLLFEQIGRTTQLLVLDREGEFATLRERLDLLTTKTKDGNVKGTDLMYPPSLR